jgi:phage baseplate assembly protein W
MAVFIGFSTQHVENVKTLGYTRGINDTASADYSRSQRVGKKYRTVDEELVITDFINALNIPQGQKPGKPDYGTTLWAFVFEPNTIDVRIELEKEIKRIGAQDPRIIINEVLVTQVEGGILMQVEMAVSPFNNATELAVLFDQATNRAQQV